MGTYSIRFTPLKCFTSKIFFTFLKSKLCLTVPTSYSKHKKWYLYTNHHKQIKILISSYITTLQKLVVLLCIYFPTAFEMPTPQERKKDDLLIEIKL